MSAAPMLAATLLDHGGNDCVEIGPRQQPQPSAGQVRVRLRAATLNRVDLYMRNSGAGIRHTLPQILGVDGAGVVDAIEAPSTPLEPGQRVLLHPGMACGQCEFCLRGDNVLCRHYQLLGEHRDGTFAQYVSLPAINVLPLPAGWDFAEGAALGTAHLTAWRMLVTRARLQPWETVLIFGIGGGVSLAGLQIARALGARTLVTSRHPQKLEQAAAMGANLTICSEQEDVVQSVMDATGGRGVDVVLENVGTAAWPAAMRSVVRGGRIVTCGATSGDQPGADLRRLFIRQISVLGSTLGTRTEMRQMLQFCSDHDLRPHIGRTFALDQLHAAFDLLESGRQFGKIALSIA